MRSTKAKLALIAVLAVLLAMLAATIAFNLFMGWKIEADATNDIKYALNWNQVDEGTGRTPNYIILDDAYEIDRSERRWSTSEETALAAWFAEHKTTGTVSRITLGDWNCYAAMETLDDYYAGEAAYEGYGFEADGYYEYWAEPSRAESWTGSSAAESRRIPGYIVVYIDITAEQALSTTVNTAFGIIAVLGAIIAGTAGYVAGRRIERAQEAQKAFYENMSHDLKTPLAAIRGYAEGVRGGVINPDDAMIAIEGSSAKMATMIDEILSLSRLEAGAVRLDTETVDVGDFIQDCLMPFEGAVRSKGLDVELELSSGTVEADYDLFEHAFSNIISNAVRHAASMISISFDGAAIRVANDGDLPTKDQLSHLFDRFYVGDGGSTGIGLAIAREIVATHGWRIDAVVQDELLVMSIHFA